MLYVSPDIFTLDDLLEIWRERAALLQPALDRIYNTHTLQDIFDAILRTDMQLSASSSSAMITEIVEHPQMKVVNVFLAGGVLDECVAAGAPGGPIEQWARKQGAKALTVDGRPGWARAVPEAVVMTVQIMRRIDG